MKESTDIHAATTGVYPYLIGRERKIAVEKEQARPGNYR